jgi:hypothetical protein
MGRTNTTAGEGSAETPATEAAAPVQVWFTVTQHAAIIGEAHHALGKRMKLPKPQAEEAQAQGLGKIEGVA